MPTAIAAASPNEPISATLAELSAWIDTAPANAARDAEAATWGRLAKVAEESGEVIAAYIGATGQNPRKGITHGMAAVQAELLDVAVTALAAVEHLTGNHGRSLDHLAHHLTALRQRMHEHTANHAA
jgi:hypothetical protein